ncbi:MAG: N-acetylmuramoyl-L-alanine amidase [Candidatus Moranbacteria bacterium]|nr:N-acetylmuramoyl-L-alanine amidase [bacterium]MDP1834163.1 N-acetylmuramoyl-L-alanine amidase [Candidatus Moranbacteria bacterium]
MKIWMVKISIGILLVGGVFLGALFYDGFSDSDKTMIDLGDKSEVVADEVAETGGIAKPEEVPEEVLKEVPGDVSPETPVKAALPEKKDPIAEEIPAKKTGSLKIVDKLVDFGYEKASERNIDTIVIHSSYDALGSDPFSVSGIIKEYEAYGVSAHYLIARDGVAYRLVADRNIAYHAGVSRVPDGRTGVNGFSIGIELVNTKTDKPTDAQYATLKKLISRIKSEYKIKYVLGHNQIAPGRKDDPWNFSWSDLE